jgi:hypothetical protein
MTAPRLQDDPAEGSREIIDRELARQPQSKGEKNERNQAASPQDAKRLVGDDDNKIAEILALKPTLAELEEAAIWSRGEGDLLGKEGRTLSGKAALICELISRDEDDEERAVQG